MNFKNTGDLKKKRFRKDEIVGLQIPLFWSGLPSDTPTLSNTWRDKNKYNETA